MRTETIQSEHDASFRHDAILYAGTADFVDRTSAFIRDSVAEREPMLVVVSAEKIELLRDELGGDHGRRSIRRHGAGGPEPCADHPRVAGVRRGTGAFGRALPRHR